VGPAYALILPPGGSRLRAHFHPVTPVAESPAIVTPETPPEPLVLILDARRRVAVAPGFDADTLRRLIEAIEARP